IPVTSTNTTIFQQFNLSGNRLIPIVPATNALFEAFPGNRIPQNMMDPIALKALEFMPKAGSYFLNSAGQLSNFVVNRFVQQDETRWTMRLDHQVTSRNRASFRYTKVPAVGTRGFV